MWSLSACTEKSLESVHIVHTYIHTYVGTNVRMYVCMRLFVTSLPCVQNYDSTESLAGGSGSWLFCFSSSFELGKFEATLAQLWQEKMQVCRCCHVEVLLVLVVHCCTL